MIRLVMFLLMPGLLLVVIACSDGDGDGVATPTSTVAPAESPMPPAGGEMSGAEGFRTFASTIQDALDVGDAEFLRDRALTEPIVCTADDVAPTGALGGRACEFEGQEFDGFTETFWRAEGAVIPVEDAFFAYETMLTTALPTDSDEFGDGSTQVYALNVGEDSFDAIITAIIERPSEFAGESSLRVSYGTAWVFEEGRWMVRSTLTAFVLGEELLQPPSQDTANLYLNWERYERP